MSVLRIAFCDDELIAIEQLKKIVKAYLMQRNFEFQFYCFQSGEELLESSVIMDILFLDIDMPKMNGMEVGEKYRIINRDCKIIMATAQEEIQKDVFNMLPFHYTTKPFEKEEICSCLEKAIENIQSMLGNKKITVYKNRNMRIVKERQIIYFKAEFGYLTVKIDGDEDYYRMTSSLSKIVKEIDQGIFCEASRQYAINLAYVTGIENKADSIKLGKETMKLSKGCKKQFLEGLQQYDLNYRE